MQFISSERHRINSTASTETSDCTRLGHFTNVWTLKVVQFNIDDAFLIFIIRNEGQADCRIRILNFSLIKFDFIWSLLRVNWLKIRLSVVLVSFDVLQRRFLFNFVLFVNGALFQQIVQRHGPKVSVVSFAETVLKRWMSTQWSPFYSSADYCRWIGLIFQWYLTKKKWNAIKIDDFS